MPYDDDIGDTMYIPYVVIGGWWLVAVHALTPRVMPVPRTALGTAWTTHAR